MEAKVVATAVAAMAMVAVVTVAVAMVAVGSVYAARVYAAYVCAACVYAACVYAACVCVDSACVVNGYGNYSSKHLLGRRNNNCLFSGWKIRCKHSIYQRAHIGSTQPLPLCTKKSTPHTKSGTQPRC